jgi:hypothetical protein
MRHATSCDAIEGCITSLLIAIQDFFGFRCQVSGIS